MGSDQGNCRMCVVCVAGKLLGGDQLFLVLITSDLICVSYHIAAPLVKEETKNPKSRFADTVCRTLLSWPIPNGLISGILYF